MIDGQLIDGVDGVVIDLLVLHHLGIVLLKSKDNVLGIPFPSSPFDLDIALHGERGIEGHDQVAARNIEALLCDTRCNQNTMLLALEFHQLLDLVVVLLLNFKQHLSHLGDEHPIHLLVEIIIVCYCVVVLILNGYPVPKQFTLTFNEGRVIFTDGELVFL